MLYLLKSNTSVISIKNAEFKVRNKSRIEKKRSTIFIYLLTLVLLLVSGKIGKTFF